MNIARFVGFICGVGVVLLLIWALSRRFNNNGSRKTEYDERQQAIRGVGYKYGFYAFVIYMCLLIAIDSLETELPVTNTVIYFTGFVLAGMVLSGYCILHDAYWGMNNNITVITRFLIGIGIVNLIVGIVEMCQGTMIIDGVLQNTFINLEAGILIAFIGIMLLIKGKRDREDM